MALATCVAALSACGTTQTIVTAHPQPKTTYAITTRPAGAPQYAYPGDEQVVYPVLEKQVAPLYPPGLVRAGVAPVTVVAQLVMDVDGRVVGVYPVSDTEGGASAALFEAAVRTAALQWTFSPLRYVHVCFDTCPDGPYRVIAKPFSLWYVFHFRVVDGRPVVETVKR